MEKLKQLFDYQRFTRNPQLQERIDSVYCRYLSQGEALSDDELNVAAAGEPWAKDVTSPPGTGENTW